MKYKKKEIIRYQCLVFRLIFFNILESKQILTISKKKKKILNFTHTKGERKYANEVNEQKSIVIIRI